MEPRPTAPPSLHPRRSRAHQDREEGYVTQPRRLNRGEAAPGPREAGRGRALLGRPGLAVGETAPPVARWMGWRGGGRLAGGAGAFAPAPAGYAAVGRCLCEAHDGLDGLLGRRSRAAERGGDGGGAEGGQRGCGGEGERGANVMARASWERRRGRVRVACRFRDCFRDSMLGVLRCAARALERRPRGTRGRALWKSWRGRVDADGASERGREEWRKGASLRGGRGGERVREISGRSAPWPRPLVRCLPWLGRPRPALFRSLFPSSLGLSLGLSLLCVFFVFYGAGCEMGIG